MSQTPSQTVGPFFAYGLCPEQYNFDFKSLFTAQIVQPEASGEHLTLLGNVYDGSGAPVGDALIEALQVDHTGEYPQGGNAREGFAGFARVGTGTDPAKRYRIDTIKPGSIGPDSAPHIDLIIHMRGMLLHAYTRVYFSDEEKANAKDAVLAQVPQSRRHTLIARREDVAGRAVYTFDIHMQGPQETVFFDL